MRLCNVIQGKYIHTYIHKSFIEKMTERINLTIREKQMMTIVYT